MRRVVSLEAQIGCNQGGVIGEAIRSCLTQLDGQAVELEELRSRLRTQERYHDLSEQGSDEEIQMGARSEDQGANGENHPGAENRSSARRRARNNAPQRGVPRMNVRAPQVLQPLDETGRSTTTDDHIQQRVQRLAVSQQQCVDRVAQMDAR